jgi:hypothetical protein
MRYVSITAGRRTNHLALYCKCYRNLKGVTNENRGGSGRRQMLGIGLGPWSWILFYFLILPPSWNEHISVSAHTSQFIGNDQTISNGAANC